MPPKATISKAIASGKMGRKPTQKVVVIRPNDNPKNDKEYLLKFELIKLVQDYPWAQERSS